jgi:hypothetical protein
MSISLLVLLIGLAVLWIWDEMRSAPIIEDDEKTSHRKGKQK